MDQGRLSFKPLALDCASAFFLMGREERRPSIIRLTAVLHGPVREEILQAALESAVRRYPFFFVRFVYMPSARVKRNRRTDIVTHSSYFLDKWALWIVCRISACIPCPGFRSY